MANRTAYRDNGLVFAQAWDHFNSKRSVLGAPLGTLTLELQNGQILQNGKRETHHPARPTTYVCDVVALCRRFTACRAEAFGSR